MKIGDNVSRTIGCKDGNPVSKLGGGTYFVAEVDVYVSTGTIAGAFTRVLSSAY